MPTVHPLKIIRPDFEYAAQVSARISGTETQDELTRILEDNPFSYLQVVKPYLHFADPEHPEKHFGFGRNYFRQLLDQKVLIEQEKPVLLIYKQYDLAQNKSFEGIIAGVSIQDYLSGAVKRHEHTRTQKELRLVKHMEVIHAVGEPVLLCYEEHHDALDFDALKGELFCDFVCESQLRHQLWNIPSDKVEIVQDFFASCAALYIADGHHRIAATTRYLQEYAEHNDTREEELTFMSLILRSDQVLIKPFHRLIHWPVIHDVDAFIHSLNTYFTIVKQNTFVKPERRGSFGLCVNGSEWFHLTLKEEYRPQFVPESLDVACLEKLIFGEILGITDSKTDERLLFARGDLDSSALQLLIDQHKANLTFTLYPNCFAEIKAVADLDGVMPPKSTWIEPKLRTGMVIQLF